MRPTTTRYSGLPVVTLDSVARELNSVGIARREAAMDKERLRNQSREAADRARDAGYSYAQIARILGMKESGVRKLLAK